MVFRIYLKLEILSVSCVAIRTHFFFFLLQFCRKSLITPLKYSGKTWIYAVQMPIQVWDIKKKRLFPSEYCWRSYHVVSLHQISFLTEYITAWTGIQIILEDFIVFFRNFLFFWSCRLELVYYSFCILLNWIAVYESVFDQSEIYFGFPFHLAC